MNEDQREFLWSLESEPHHCHGGNVNVCDNCYGDYGLANFLQGELRFCIDGRREEVILGDETVLLVATESKAAAYFGESEGGLQDNGRDPDLEYEGPGAMQRLIEDWAEGELQAEIDSEAQDETERMLSRPENFI